MAKNSITAGELLRDSALRLREAGIDTARLDAELLLADVLGCERISFYTHPECPVTEDEYQSFTKLLERRLAREPLAYITGTKEFMGEDFAVCPGILIPRPDTEVLVEKIIELFGPESERKEPAILDLCSGSGAIGLSAGIRLPGAKIVLSDVSETAVVTGRRNADSLSVNAEVRHGDLFETLLPDERFDLIVSNPPYIAEDEIKGLEPEVSVWEPRLALSGGADGYQFYRRIVSQAQSHLASDGVLMLEAGDGQAQTLRELLENAGYARIEEIRDLTGTVRGLAAFLV